MLRDSRILGSDTLELSGTGEKMTMFPQAEESSKMRKNWTRRSTEGLDGWQCCARAEDCEKDMCQDNCEIWLTPTDPRVLMVWLLAQPEKGLVRPDDVAELHFWSNWRLLAHSSSQWDENHETVQNRNLSVKQVRRREHAIKQEHEARLKKSQKDAW